MQKVISTIITFVIVTLIYSILHYQHSLNAGDSLSFFTEPMSVPPIILAVLLPIYILCLWLILTFLKYVKSDQIIYPLFWVEEIETTELTVIWQRISVFTSLILPFIGFAYFWVRLHKADVWERVTKNEVEIWSIPHAVFGGKGGYRYGDVSEAIKEGSKQNGVDFIPFGQPLLYVVFTVIALILAINIARKLEGRQKRQRTMFLKNNKQ